jgi:flagellar biosynthesis/type III secretory pathway chaperone
MSDLHATAEQLPPEWDSDFTALLDELTDVQTELLAVLEQKRRLLGQMDSEGLEAIQDREGALVGRLQQCQERRQLLLEQASATGTPAPNLRTLARARGNERHRASEPRLQQAQLQARLLQHHALTNWVIAQKTLLHLTHLLEIVATGGRLQPTYGQIGDTAPASGILFNHAG